LLVKIKRDLENQVRGLLKNLGLVIGRGTFNVFTARAKELIADRPELTPTAHSADGHRAADRGTRP
jgi:transposase